MHRYKYKKALCVLATAAVAASSFCMYGCAADEQSTKVTLRVANWEEYIDLGEWDDEEMIDIDNAFADDPSEGVFGANSMVDDFVEWFNSTHDYEIEVEYSTFGTNEDLYNRLSLGDVYDLVCPSDYMIMKLLDEDAIEPYSETFFDESNDENYYINGVSKYIDDIFVDYDWNKYAACYMWGTTGFVYNPLLVDVDDVSSCNILQNGDYFKQVTIKDNVRDAYFATLSIIYNDELFGIPSGDAGAEQRSALLNDTSNEAIAAAEDMLKNIKENVYSFETDSGKADMVTGKVLANYQWSGDAVYIMDEADSDELNPTELWYSVPDECTNLWFDGWVMLKRGIDGDERRKEAAEAFVNFLSRPDNAVRNMYYIGYTSAIADDMIYDYMDWNYGFVFDPSDEEYFDEELTEVYEYDLSYFFGEGYTLYVDAATLELGEGIESTTAQLGLEDYGNDITYTVYSGGNIDRGRQLFGQYPTANIIDRSVVMLDFGDKLTDINQMWIHVRCLDLLDFDPVVVGVVAAVIAVLIAAILLYRFRYRIFIKKYRPRKGYARVDMI